MRISVLKFLVGETDNIPLKYSVIRAIMFFSSRGQGSPQKRHIISF